MSNTWLGFGVFCMLAAITGGGLKVLGHELPVINSILRQSLLFGFGLVIVAASQFYRFISWIPDEILVTDRFTLGAGATHQFPLFIGRSGRVTVTLQQVTQELTGFAGPLGLPGQDSLDLSLCGAASSSCERRQLGQAETIGKDLSPGPGSISVFNYSKSPPMSFILKIRKPRCLPLLCEKDA